MCQSQCQQRNITMGHNWPPGQRLVMPAFFSPITDVRIAVAPNILKYLHLNYHIVPVKQHKAKLWCCKLPACFIPSILQFPTITPPPPPLFLSPSFCFNLHKNEAASCKTDTTSVLIRINWNLWCCAAALIRCFTRSISRSVVLFRDVCSLPLIERRAKHFNSVAATLRSFSKLYTC